MFKLCLAVSNVSFAFSRSLLAEAWSHVLAVFRGSVARNPLLSSPLLLSLGGTASSSEALDPPALEYLGRLVFLLGLLVRALARPCRCW